MKIRIQKKIKIIFKKKKYNSIKNKMNKILKQKYLIINHNNNNMKKFLNKLIIN